MKAKSTKAANDPDTYDWNQAMASPYRSEFLQAAQQEIDELTKKGTWFEDDICNATTKVIPSKWVFRVKRKSDGTLKRFKGRICLRGDLQDDDGESNYSPVAAWPTVRSFLLISVVNNWVTTSIDFSNAFLQASLDESEQIWMEIPRGYKSSKGPHQCLKLVKSLYGHKRAPQLWFNHSSEAFKAIGLKQSKYDECLWYGEDIMVVQYVDDCGISAPTQERIDLFVEALRLYGLELTQEESFEEFLGIKFHFKADKSIECTQVGLIQKILTAAGMEDCNPNSTPTMQYALGSHKEAEPMDESWNYRGICGMLLYLSTNTRPDIAFAVSQVCRFSSNPKKPHATAIKFILRYLKGTQNRGTIIQPTQNPFELNLYVDADFCGLFHQEDDHDPNSVKSRTGYIIELGGWPIIWKSSLQTRISISTLEAEYTALSSSLKTFMPLKWLIEEIIQHTNADQLKDVRVLATVFEDNQSTYCLATNQKLTNRTRYLLTSYHWFWSLVNDKEGGGFTVVKCPSSEMKADYLTKPQPRAVFEHNRALVQGW